MKPRMMMTNRDITLSTTYGYIVAFKANKPVPVPGLAVEQAMQIGAAFCEADAEFVPNNTINTEKEPLYGFERKEALITAMNSMVERNDSDEFTSTGLPRLKALEEEVGFEVDRNEVNPLWLDIQKAQAEALKSE